MELRFIRYQHNGSIIAKINYAKQKFSSNKCKLIGFRMKVYGSIRIKNGRALRNTLFEGQINRTHREAQQLVPSVLHGVNCHRGSVCWDLAQVRVTTARTALLTWDLATKRKWAQWLSWSPRCLSCSAPYPMAGEEIPWDFSVSAHQAHLVTWLRLTISYGRA